MVARSKMVSIVSSKNISLTRCIRGNIALKWRLSNNDMRSAPFQRALNFDRKFNTGLGNRPVDFESVSSMSLNANSLKNNLLGVKHNGLQRAKCKIPQTRRTRRGLHRATWSVNPGIDKLCVMQGTLPTSLVNCQRRSRAALGPGSAQQAFLVPGLKAEKRI
jgi:hypothetical protein